MKYYFRPDSNSPPIYTYITSKEDDVLWDAEKCIEVSPRPSVNHEYNFETKEWVLNEGSLLDELRFERNKELFRTDKFVLFDFPITDSEKDIAIKYRDELRKFPENEEKVLPECPDECKI